MSNAAGKYTPTRRTSGLKTTKRGRSKGYLEEDLLLAVALKPRSVSAF
jgi:hypothetical protein